MTNEEFARRTGCHFTMASRLRNGNRLPSADLLHRIVTEFGLDPGAAMKARAAGKAVFSAWLVASVFEAPTLTEASV